MLWGRGMRMTTTRRWGRGLYPAVEDIVCMHAAMRADQTGNGLTVLVHY